MEDSRYVHPRTGPSSVAIWQRPACKHRWPPVRPPRGSLATPRLSTRLSHRTQYCHRDLTEVCISVPSRLAYVVRTFVHASRTRAGKRKQHHARRYLHHVPVKLACAVPIEVCLICDSIRRLCVKES